MSVELTPRDSEECWRELLDRMELLVLLVDPDDVVTYVSPAVERGLGYSAEEIIGCELNTLVHRNDDPAIVQALEHCSAGEPADLVHSLRARDDSWHTLESTFIRLTRPPFAGSLLVSGRDVTEALMLSHERERADLERRVSQRLEAVGQLAAGIAHEINTPLQFVGDSVAFLKDAVEELVRLTGLYRETLYTEAAIPVDERRAAMRAAEELADVDYLCERIPSAFARTADGIDRVRSIVMAMKRFSHASAAESAPADINEAIETTLAVCRNEYKYVADVVVDLGELPPVTCNIGELNQVFLNLIVNAAQAIEEQLDGGGGRGEIRISTRVEGGDVVIEIADDGPGISAELQDRIYEPFFTTKEVGKGTGQGLALARSTIARHSGTLGCVSSPGAGAIFTITLPAPSPAGSQAEVQR